VSIVTFEVRHFRILQFHVRRFISSIFSRVTVTPPRVGFRFLGSLGSSFVWGGGVSKSSSIFAATDPTLLLCATEITKCRLALAGRNTTGPPWSVGRMPGGRSARSPAGSVTDNDRRQTPTDASEQNNTGLLGGPVVNTLANGMLYVACRHRTTKQDAIGDGRLRPRCCHLANSTKIICHL